MRLIARVTGTGNANSTRLHLVQFHALPVPDARAIDPHTALSTVLLAIPTHLAWRLVSLVGYRCNYPGLLLHAKL